MTRVSDIGIVIVGLNAREYLRNCLQSLHETDWDRYGWEIVYIDNRSTDDSIDVVRNQFPKVKVIANAENVGFCRAANQGSELTAARYLLHLNNDTLVYPDAIPQLARFLDRTERAAIVGGRLLNPDLTDQWSARRFPSPINAIWGRRSVLARRFPQAKPVREYLFKSQLAGISPFRVDWVGTPCMMVRRDIFEEVGGFPSDFYYWHESVFCSRVFQRGGETWVVPTAKVVHFEGQGGGPRPYQVKRWHIIDFHRGAYRLQIERFGLRRSSLLRWMTAIGLSARAALMLIAIWIQDHLPGGRSV